MTTNEAKRPTERSGRAVSVLHYRRQRLHPHGDTTSVDHVLTYLVEGWLHMDHGGRIEIGPGMVTVIPAGVPHKALGGRDAEVWQVRFCASCFRLDESDLLMTAFRMARRGALPVVPIEATRRAKLQERFAELEEEARRTTLESLELCRALLLLILGDIGRAMGRIEVGVPTGSLVGEALEFIQRRCFEGISLKDVAAAVHRTPAHVASAVKEATGFAVGEWILSGRVTEAATRLVHTDERVSEIGRRVGWPDTTHFIRQFKKIYGLSPSAWRTERRARHIKAEVVGPCDSWRSTDGAE
jgi:AraC family transcriptional regulator, transcriptional activator of pobA